MAHTPDLIDSITEGSWMEGSRPCSYCSFVISNEQADKHGGMCKACFEAHIEEPEYDQFNPHHYWNIEDWRDEVADGSTYRGYSDWVQALIEEKSDELTHLEEEFEEDGGRNPDLASQIDELRQMLDPTVEAGESSNKEDDDDPGVSTL